MRAVPTSKGNRTNCQVFMKTEIQPGGLGTHMAVLLNIAVVSASFPIGEAIDRDLSTERGEGCEADGGKGS